MNGAITALHGNLLQGWAYDPAAPDARLVIEIDLDGVCVALVQADQPQLAIDQETAPVQGDGFHGFTAQLPLSWLQGATRLTARVANGGPWLDGALVLSTPDAETDAPAPPVSRVYYSGGLRLSGWVWDPAAPDRHVGVQARSDGQLVAHGRADQPHPELSKHSTLDHGFTLDLPWELADGQLHQIDLVTDQGQALTPLPIRLLEHPHGLRDLLARHWPGAPDDPALQCLLTLAGERDRRAPQVMGFAHYHHWWLLHQLPAAAPRSSAPPPLGVLVQTSTSAAMPSDDSASSLASLRAQQWPAHRIVLAETAQWLAALQQLLAADCAAVLLLHAGDQLAPEALRLLSETLFDSADHSPQAAWVYADSDQLDAQGHHQHPWLKPAWDPDWFLGVDWVSAGGLFSAAILRQALHQWQAAPALRQNPDPAQALMAALVAVTQATDATVVHLPRVLHHRAASAVPHPAAAAPNPARLHAMQWLADHWAPGARARPCPRYPALVQVIWPLPQPLPTITLIIPTRDRHDLLKPCLEGLLERTQYPALEIIVVDNQSSCPITLAYFEQLAQRGVRILSYPQPFNYAAINNFAVAQAQGDWVGFLNNDIEVLEPHWLHAMASELARPGTGAVGAKLLWDNGLVQHGGVILGINGLAAHVGNAWWDHDPGYLACNQVARRYSAVTAACLLMPRDLFLQLGGFDAETFPVNFNDVDLCLNIRQAGYRIAWTPLARLRHAESASRGTEQKPAQAARVHREQQALLARWGECAVVDPCYHPALNHEAPNGPYAGLQPDPLEWGTRAKNHIETLSCPTSKARMDQM